MASARYELESKIALAGRFFDSEGGDFQSYLADYFMSSGLDADFDDGFTREMAEEMAKDIVDTYMNLLDNELVENHAMDGV